MKKIKANRIQKIVAELCIEANIILRKDVLDAIKLASRMEKNIRAKRILKALIENASIAKNEKIALCQDTGMAVVFLEIGQNLRITGDLNNAVNSGVRDGYKRGFLRKSIVEPLSRINTNDNTPAIIHTRIVPGDKLKVCVFPKGFGCEAKFSIKMFEPTAATDEIIDFVVKTVKDAGPDACPPYIVGIGIGGTIDYACILAKRALLKKITHYTSRLEQRLLREINKLNIGPMGLGGKTTCLGVNILTFPTHIAGLPVAVNISCHALRSACKTL